MASPRPHRCRSLRPARFRARRRHSSRLCGPLRAAGTGRGLAGRGADPHQRPDAAQSPGPHRALALVAPRGVAAGHQGLWRACPAARRAGAREPLGDARAAQLLLESGALPARGAGGQGVELVDPAAGADRGLLAGQRHERHPGARRLCRPDATRGQHETGLSRRRRPRGPGGRCRPAGAGDRLVGRIGESAQRDLQRHQRRRVRLAQCVARHRRRAGLRGRRARAAETRYRDPPAGSGVGGDPRRARIEIGKT